MTKNSNRSGLRNKLLLLFVIVFAMGFTLCGCGSSGGDADTEDATEAAQLTLEQYAADNPDFQEQLDSYEDCAVTAEGNNLVYTYDCKDMGFTEEQAHSEEVVEAFNEELDKQAETFQQAADDLELATGIEEIHVVTKYVYDDYEIISRTFGD